MRGRNVSRLIALTLVLMLAFASSAFAVRGDAPQVMVSSNAVKLTLHLSNGSPAVGVPVYVYQPSGASWSIKPIWKSTASDGSWETTLAPGAYKLDVAGSASAASGFWSLGGLKPLLSSGDTVTVPASPSATQTLEATAPAPARFSGTIVAHATGSGIPTAVATPYVVNPSTGQWEALWGAMAYGGDFDFNRLLPGTYRFQFEAENPRWIPEFWNDKPDLLAADSVNLIAGQSITSVVVTLSADVASDSVAGDNRILTSIEASKRMYPDAAHHAGAVIITTGWNWPDALGASGLAGAANAPVLLNVRSPGAMPSFLDTEVVRLKNDGATDAYILGDTNAVAAAVETRLKAIYGSTNVHRLAGKNRYETSLKVAAEARAKSTTWSGRVFLARGNNFADALAASPVAARQGWPIVLAEGDGAGGLSAGVTGFLSENATGGVVILGNYASISLTVENAAKAAVGIATVERWAGDTRFDTAADVVRHALALGMSPSDLGIATGFGYADALCGGPYLAKVGSPLLLVNPAWTAATDLSRPPTFYPMFHDELGALSPDVLTVHFFGGLPTLPQPVRDTVVDRLR